MQITRNALDTNPGPADWFTGEVFIDMIAAAAPVGAAAVHFTPGARTAEGVGRCQREGGPIEVIRPGDRVFFEPGENHWHGAAPDTLHDAHRDPTRGQERQPRHLGEHVSDEEYGQAPDLTEVSK